MTDFERAVQDYNTRRPGLAAHRGARYGRQNMIMALLALALFAVAFSLLRRGWVGTAVATVFIGVIALGIVFTVIRFNADSPGEEAREAMRQSLFPALFPQIEGLTLSPDTRGFYDEIPDALKPGGDRAGWGDLIEGRYRGLPIAINEVRVSQSTERNGHRETFVVFEGIAIRTALSRPVPALIVAQEPEEPERWLSAVLPGGPAMPRLETGDPGFDSVFEAYASDAGFARGILNDEGRAALLDLKHKYSKGRLQLAAQDDAAWLLFEHDRDFFELPPLERDFDADADGRRLRAEMHGMLEMIDAVRDLLAK